MKTESFLVFLKRIVLFFFLLVYTNNYSQYVFKSDDLPDKLSLQDYTSIADVGQEDLDIQFVLKEFKTLNPKELKLKGDYLGFTENNFWSMTSLVNDTDVELHYYFETARPITDLVELYIVNQVTGEIKKEISGDAMAYKDRSHPNRRSLFDLKIAPKANLKLVMHIKSDGEVVKLPLILYSPEGFVNVNSTEQFVFGIFYGVLAIVAIIYFFFFLGLKESTFLYYSLYVVSVGLLQFALDGYFYQYITPGGGWFSNHAVLFLAIIGAFLSGKYSELFLKIKTYSKTIYLMYRVSYVLLLVLLFFAVFVPVALIYCYQIVNLLVLVFLFLIVFSIGYLYYSKKAVDSLFTIGIFFLILGFGVFILNNLGLIENTFVTQNSSKIGTGLEVIFLSLSMSNLIRKLKNEKEEFNRIALVKSEEMNELKSYFLSNISHELRTPLNAISNLIENVSSEVKDKKVKKNCEVIKYSAQSLLGSVNDILDFSKIEKNELRLENKEFDLLKVLKDVKYNAKVKSKDKGLKFSFTKPDLAISNLIGDENRLFQILNNVLNNAIKFTSDGFVDFKVEVEKKSDTIAAVKMIVTDSGVGIAKEKMDSLFDSFSQHSIDNKRKFGGLGLGLYIVKTLVDMQDGLLEIQSEVNKGTVCTITLDYEIVTKKIIPNVPVVESAVCDLGGKTLLVVEDNAMNQMVIKMITKKWLNTTVVYANNGQEGLDAFANNKIDLVLMDLQMPVMDGYEATIAIRNGEVGAENANIPIVAVTADVMESTKLRVAEIGMNHYLSKPINKELLYQVVSQMVN
ncbi:MAG: hybrid sensor histidine kinase/response regulator [Flavobacteriales bacterium 32-34-25]|nr:MAG: hybrid sensor histidine kinase/response regulator [Flavobacteriales bacterium 32-34-25]